MKLVGRVFDLLAAKTPVILYDRSLCLHLRVEGRLIRDVQHAEHH